MFEYILHPKFQLKDMVVSDHVQTPPIAPICSVPLKHITGMLKRAFFHPDVLLACRHHSRLLTMMIKKKASLFSVKIRFWLFNLLLFWPCFILFCMILWQENETKGKESLHTFYFKVQFIWDEHQTWMFYLIPQVATSLFPEM